MMIAEGRKIAEGLPAPKKAELMRLCDEAEILTNQLSDLCRKGQVRRRGPEQIPNESFCRYV